MLRAGSRASMRMASQRKLGVQVWCRCLWEYKAEYEDDLRIEPGDIIQVTDAEYDEGWWEGLNMRTGAQGIFPINHVEPCDEGPGQRSAVEQGRGGGGGGGGKTFAAAPAAASVAVSNPMSGGGIPGPPPKGAKGMMRGGGGGVPGPPPKGAKGMTGGGGQPGGGGSKPGGKGGGGRRGKGGGGGRAKAGANSKTRFGIYGANLTIYGSMLWVVLGLAVLIWTGLGDPDPTTGEVRGRNPWLHECASAHETCKCYWFGGYVLDGVEVPVGEKVNHTKCPFESYAAGGVLTIGVDGSIPGVVKGSPTDLCLRNPTTMPQEGVEGFSRALCERPADIDVLPPTFVGLYCIFAGLGIGGYEFYTGFLRDGTFPKRTPLYVALTLPGYFTLPTIFGGIFIILGSALQIYGAVKFAEVYHFRRGMHEVRVCQHMLITFKMGKYGSACDRVATCIGGANPEGKFGRIMFGILYVTVNLMLGIIWFNDAAQSSANARAIASNKMFDFTVWVPVAKFFGVIMNMNFTVIFIPVSRVFIKRLYNESTGSQTSCARIVRTVLLLFPLDYALEFHMLCGIIGYISAILHTFAHVVSSVILKGANGCTHNTHTHARTHARTTQTHTHTHLPPILHFLNSPLFSSTLQRAQNKSGSNSDGGSGLLALASSSALPYLSPLCTATCVETTSTSSTIRI
jgi:hypothetical protein